MRLICMVALVCIQGLIPLCAQKDILFQFAGTTEEVSARVLGSNNVMSNYDQSLADRGLRLTLTADEEGATLSFSKGITAFSIAALNRISGIKPNSQDVGCLIKGYTHEGEEVTAYHFFDTYDGHQPQFLTLEVLSKRPILFFPEEILKLSIIPVNLGSKDMIQFTIDGLSKSSFDYGYLVRIMIIALWKRFLQCLTILGLFLIPS